MTTMRSGLVFSALCLLMLPATDILAQGDQGRPPAGIGQSDSGRDRGRGPGRGQGREQGRDPLGGRVSAGAVIPGFKDLAAHKPDGSKALLSELVPEEGHLVIVTGCLTCPKFLISHRDVEAVAHDYRSTEHPVAFVYLYKSLAHPENGRWIQPFTIEERLSQVKSAATDLKTRIPFICDPMDNSVSTALGGSPNAAYVVQRDGTIDYVSGWADGAQLRTALNTIVGATETVSTPEEIGVPAFSRPYRNTGTVVPRVEVSGTMSPLRTRPADSEEPFYVKLRVEAEPQLLQGSPGKLYVGVHLDPVHGVHWNNLVDPVTFTMKTPEGVEIAPLTWTGPKVEAATDSDPREVLLDVAGWPEGSEVTFDVTYYACSEKEGWCKAVTQSYVVSLERDRSAGMAQGRWERGGARGQGGGQAPGGGADPIARMDTDGDGRLAPTEVGGRMRERFAMFDTNGDGFIADKELEQVRQRMSDRMGQGRRGQGRGGQGRGGRGGRDGGGGGGGLPGGGST